MIVKCIISGVVMTSMISKALVKCSINLLKCSVKGMVRICMVKCIIKPCWLRGRVRIFKIAWGKLIVSVMSMANHVEKGE